MARRWTILLVALVALAAMAAAAVAWVFAERLLVPQPYGLQPEFEIVAVEDDAVVLPAPGEAQFARTDVEGRYDLLYEGGAGRLGAILERNSEGVVRAFEHDAGRPPRAGDPARIDVTLYRDDPERAHGYAFEAIDVQAPVGAVPAWWLEGDGDTAVLMLHGRRRARRTEALRTLPLYRETGASVLVASYRNHDAAPASEDGFYTYGLGEAEDARAAARFLGERGVERVVLVGFSMGAAVALTALEAWPEAAPEPVGLVLEAPLVSPRATFVAAARRTPVPLPGLFTRAAMRVARWRADVAWPELDWTRRPPPREMPTLVVAGTADGTVPIDAVDAFVQRLPDEARYLRLEGVEHMEAWNAAPERYARAVRDLLASVGLQPAAAGAD